MGYGREEEWEEDRESALTALEKRVCAYFEYDHDEWLEMGKGQRAEAKSVYRLCGKK